MPLYKNTIGNFVDFISNQMISGIKTFTSRLGLGLSNPQADLHIDKGTATASNIKFTAGATTGQTVNDGFNIGIDQFGTAVFEQKKNTGIIFSTNNNPNLFINNDGTYCFGTLSGFYNNPLNFFAGTLPTVNNPSPNRLSNANKRYTITSTNITNVNNIFDNNFDNSADIDVGISGSLTVETSNFTYTEGLLVITFYDNLVASNILVESQKQTQVASNTWTTVFSSTNNTKRFLIIDTNSNILGNYLSKLRFTLSSSTNAVRISEIEWFTSRPEVNEIGYIPQYQSGTLNTFIDTLNLDSSTPSTSPTTGALVVAGGIGLGGNINLGGNVTANGSINSLNNITSNAAFKGLGLHGLSTAGVNSSGLNLTIRTGVGTGNGVSPNIVFQTPDATISGSNQQLLTDKMTLTGIGDLLLGTNISDNTNRLQVSGNIKATQYRLSALNTAPISSSDIGITGEIKVSSTGVHVCTNTNTWQTLEFDLYSSAKKLYRSGFVYVNHPFFGSFASSGAALATNSITYVPIRIDNNLNISKFSINVTTGVSGGEIKLGLYSNVNAMPGNLIANSAPLNTGFNGVKDWNLIPNLTLQAGWYWMGLITNSTAPPSITTAANYSGFNAVIGNNTVNPGQTLTAIRKTNYTTFSTVPTEALQDSPITYIYNQMPIIWFTVV